MVEPYREAYAIIAGESGSGSRSPTEVLELVNFATLRSGVEFADLEEVELKTELDKLLKELEYEHLKQVRDETGRLISKIEQSGSEEDLAKHLKNLDEVVKKLHSLRTYHNNSSQNAKAEIKKD